MNISLLETPFSGADLVKLYNHDYHNTILNCVSKSPEFAISKITQRYGFLPQIHGNNIPDIVFIRDSLFNIVKAGNYSLNIINAFIIVAPHTHWKNECPIIYHFHPESNRYIIGPHALSPQEYYVPVSFVFNYNNPIAYEWTTINICRESEWIDAVNILKELNNRVAHLNIPFGVSFDFRFKDSLFESSIHSVEIPIDDETQEYNGFSEIVSQEESENKSTIGGLEQVAWHANSDLILNLNENEQELLLELRDELEGLSQNDAQELLSLLFELSSKHSEN